MTREQDNCYVFFSLRLRFISDCAKKIRVSFLRFVSSRDYPEPLTALITALRSLSSRFLVKQAVNVAVKYLLLVSTHLGNHNVKMIITLWWGILALPWLS